MTGKRWKEKDKWGKQDRLNIETMTLEVNTWDTIEKVEAKLQDIIVGNWLEE